MKNSTIRNILFAMLGAFFTWIWHRCCIMDSYNIWRYVNSYSICVCNGRNF